MCAAVFTALEAAARPLERTCVAPEGGDGDQDDDDAGDEAGPDQHDPPPMSNQSGQTDPGW